jgi:hypothetical protein
LKERIPATVGVPEMTAPDRPMPGGVCPVTANV